jgi:hypothetical protein
VTNSASEIIVLWFQYIQQCNFEFKSIKRGYSSLSLLSPLSFSLQNTKNPINHDLRQFSININEKFRLGAVNTHDCMQSARDWYCWINIKRLGAVNTHDCMQQFWIINHLILIQQFRSLADCMQTWVLTAPNLKSSFNILFYS